MGFRHIPDRDSLFRHSIDPLSFRSNRFVPERLFKLYDEPGNLIVASVAWERFVPSTRHVHEYGCRLALRRNEQKRADGTFKEKNQQVYCGAYQLKAEAVREIMSVDALRGIISSADVVHKIEGGEISHSNIEIRLVADGLNNEGTKTEILVRLWNVCTGPMRHVCDTDQDVVPHRSQTLSSGPAGSYVDVRGYLERLFFSARFRILEWLWRRLRASRPP